MNLVLQFFLFIFLSSMESGRVQRDMFARSDLVMGGQTCAAVPKATIGGTVDTTSVIKACTHRHTHTHTRKFPKKYLDGYLASVDEIFLRKLWKKYTQVSTHHQALRFSCDGTPLTPTWPQRPSNLGHEIIIGLESKERRFIYAYMYITSRRTLRPNTNNTRKHNAKLFGPHMTKQNCDNSWILAKNQLSDLLTFRPQPHPFMAMVDFEQILCIIRRTTMTKLSNYKRLVS